MRVGDEDTKSAGTDIAGIGDMVAGRDLVGEDSVRVWDLRGFLPKSELSS